jgi:acetyl esterase/lipase
MWSTDQKYSSPAGCGQSLGFNPSYLPAGKTAEQVAEQNGLEVQAAVLNYGSYDLYQGSLQGFEETKNPFWLMAGSVARGLFGDGFNAIDNPELYRAVSPVYNIPQSAERKLPPQLLTVGSDDNIMTPASVRDYVEKLKSSGHPVQYWEYKGRGHAFLDSGSNIITSMNFEADAPQALDVMGTFLDSIFYPAP